MIKINARKISGSWQEGYALDQHILKSEYIGHNEYGYPQFDTTRSEIGELLYKLERIPITFEHSPHGERSSCILVR